MDDFEVLAINPDRWKAAINQAVPCCVVLKVTQTRAFDTESAGSSYATGFIVDRRRGIILTNRHVVTPGPIVADAIFNNREELPVHPLYRDPVHDFGFLRFDPSKLQFMEVSEVPLAPEAASVGLDIRVVGNDSGEKISILSGTLARLDRDAPNYGKKGYNDFNTFYFQAASGTKGGSSGSPVIDIQGRAVALNAGSKTKAASAYYLPLERVVRALKMLQKCHQPGDPADKWTAVHIPRGDLQATFTFKGFEEVRRLGLRSATEALVRSAPVCRHGCGQDAATVGMLVVDSVVPGSPADKVLEPGDVLVQVQGQVVTHFLALEELLDECVGQTVELVLERGGQEHIASVQVTDLHSVTPSEFLEVAGGSVHALSYQQARNNKLQVGQVYIAEPGYMFSRAHIPKHAIITSLAGQPTPDLPTFAGVLHTLAHAAKVPLEYYTFSERHRKRSALLTMDRQWYGAPLHWSRDDAAGVWHPSTEYPPAGAAGGKAAVVKQPQPAPEMQPASEEMESSDDEDMAAADSNSAESAYEARMRSCMVLVDVDIPLVALADGVHSRSFCGNGIIVHHGQNIGLVLVDRNTVAIGMGDIEISFGAHPAEVPAKIRYLHPLHNFAILSYNPADLPPEARSKVAAAQLMNDPPLRRGDKVTLVGISKSLKIMSRSSVVTSATAAVSISAADVPRFRAVHEEVIRLDQDFGATFSGVLTDEQGRVRAVYASYAEQVGKEEQEWCAGMPTHTFYSAVQQLKGLEQEPGLIIPPIRVLDAELETLLLSKAAQFGLPSSWVSRLDRLDPERRQVLRVRTCVAQSHAAEVLKGGDMLLAVAGKPVTCFRDVQTSITSYPGPVSTAKQEQPPPTAAGTSTEESSRASKRFKTIDAANGSLQPEANGNVSSTPSDADCLQLPSVPLTIFRGGAVMEVEVRLAQEDPMGTDRLVHWCGAQIQAPYRAVRELGFVPDACGVYISRWHHGSPCHRYGLYALHWLQEVNGLATPDLDTFLDVVQGLRHGDFVRVKVCHLATTEVKVLSLKLDLKYWPTWELRLDKASCTWSRRQVSSG